MLLHRLALGLGRTKAELKRSLANLELIEWAAYFEVDALLQKELGHGKSPQEAMKWVREMVELHKD